MGLDEERIFSIWRKLFCITIHSQSKTNWYNVYFQNWVINSSHIHNIRHIDKIQAAIRSIFNNGPINKDFLFKLIVNNIFSVIICSYFFSYNIDSQTVKLWHMKYFSLVQATIMTQHFIFSWEKSIYAQKRFNHNSRDYKWIKST